MEDWVYADLMFTFLMFLALHTSVSHCDDSASSPAYRSTHASTCPIGAAVASDGLSITLPDVQIWISR